MALLEPCLLAWFFMETLAVLWLFAKLDRPKIFCSCERGWFIDWVIVFLKLVCMDFGVCVSFVAGGEICKNVINYKFINFMAYINALDLNYS